MLVLRRGDLPVLLGIGILFLIAYFAVRPSDIFGDEGFHRDQVGMFLRGEFRLAGGLTMLPGYHAVLSLFAILTGKSTMGDLRLYNLCLSYAGIWIFHGAVRSIHPNVSIWRTVQFAFLPVLFPYFFLIYTDALSTMLVILAVWAAHKERPALSALAGIASMLVRQNNILWLAFAALWMIQAGPWLHRLLQVEKTKDGLHLRIQSVKHLGKNLWKLFLRLWPFALSAALFAAFMLWNNGVALGDRGSHPAFVFHIGNVVFLLLVAGFILLPQFLLRVKKTADRMRANPSAYIVLILGAFLVYWYAYANDHPYNQVEYDVYLRNKFLVFGMKNVWHRLLFFVPVVVALISIPSIRLKRRAELLLYPMTLLFLFPSWLIEHRYYIIPFSLFLLLREQESERAEAGIALFSIIVSLGLYLPVIERTFFL